MPNFLFAPKKIRSYCLCLGLVLALSQSALAASASSTVTLQLNWLHQFEFAGYYAALHKGFYQDAGLVVTVKEGSPNISPIDEVSQGRADFGVSSSGLVKSFLEGKPVLVLAPIFQHSPEVLLSLGSSIKTPSDVAKAGAIGLQPGDESLDLKAMFLNEGITLDKLNINTQANGLDDLLAGKIVAMNAFLSNEPFYLQQRKIAYSVIDPNQYGMDFYNGVLFTSQAALKDHPEVVAAFRNATLKGWEYALAHQDEIIELILSRYNTQAKSREYLAFEAKTLEKLIGSDVIHMGHSNASRWKLIVDTYAKFGIIKFDYSLDGFLYDPNPPPPDLTWLYQLLALVLLASSVLSVVALYIHRLNRRLLLANKVEQQTLLERHQFMDMLTHELKTPVSVVTLSLDQLTATTLQKRRATQALEDMSSLIERCQQLDLLEHQKPALQLQSCNVVEILTQIQANNPYPGRLTITSESLLDLTSDVRLLRMILGNLIKSALKYAPPLSPITISAQAATDANRAGIQICLLNLPGAAGLPDPAKIFEKYYRSPGAQKQSGSGLGLYLVRSFVTQLGGHVRYETEQGKAKFSLWLPLVCAQSN
jgi:ABC-type nitrate/sulfonate/bicarbonate transport system substrate-binding protein/two-component sensor histidine kinase